MIANIQTLRFLAAAAVVYYHTGFGVFGVATEFGAVPMFFCISGYIMTMITRDRSDDFLPRRIIRVVPMYWLLTFAYWALITVPGGLPRIVEALMNIEPLAKSLLFIPYRDAAGHMQPVLNVGWTLNYEMYFYVVFAGCLLINRRLAPVFCGISIVLIAGILSPVENDVAQFYANEHVLYFVAGIVVYYMADYVPAGKAAALISAAILCGYLLQGFVLPHVQYSPAAAVLAVIALEKSGYSAKSPVLMLLGAASYAIYLGHFLILHTYRIGVLKTGLPAFESNLAVAVAVTLASIAFGVWLHLRIERPITDWLNSRRAVRRRTRPGY